MVFLIASILLMSLLAVLLRWAVRQGTDPHGLNAAYRVTGGLVTLAVALPALDWARLPEFWQTAGRAGLAAALFYWLTGLASIKSVQLGDLGITWAVIRCSMIIPTLASMIWWREVPLWPPSPLLAARLAGVAGIAVALFLLGANPGAAPTPGVPPPSAAAVSASRGRPWVLWLTLAFVAQGAWEICLRATRAYPDSQVRSFFVTLAFAAAMVPAGASAAVSGVRLRRRELSWGVLAGICALSASTLRVWALREVDGTVAFPATTVGVVLLVQTAGCLLWGERLGPRRVAGLVLAVAGLLLLTAPF